MATKFKSHESLILDTAVERIFAQPVDLMPRHRIEGMLSGFAAALQAIGSPIVTAAKSKTDTEAVGA